MTTQAFDYMVPKMTVKSKNINKQQDEIIRKLKNKTLDQQREIETLRNIKTESSTNQKSSEEPAKSDNTIIFAILGVGALYLISQNT